MISTKSAFLKCVAVSFVGMVGFLSASAQTEIPAFGALTQDELSLRSVDFEPGADACILIQIGRTGFTELNGRICSVTTYRRRVKILSDKGVYQANMVLTYYSRQGMEEIDDIRGETFNLDKNGGLEVLTLEPQNIYKKKVDKETTSLWFALPGVRKGSIIEVSYKKICRHYLEIDPWVFQDEIPTCMSQYTISMPPHLAFIYAIHKSFPVTVREDKMGDSVVRVFTMKNVPGLKDEPLMTTPKDYWQRVEFRGAANAFYEVGWATINNNLLNNPYFGEQLHNKIHHTDSLDLLISGLKDTVPRMTAIYEYVRRHFYWDGEKDFYCEDVKDIWDKKKGSTGDINLLLINLLRDAGIDAKAVLVSTRGNGVIDTAYHSLRQFNKVVAYVNTGGRTYILDATSKYTPYKLIPPDLYYSRGLVIQKGKPAWLDLVNMSTKFTTRVSLVANMDDQGKIKSTANIYNIDYSRISRCEDLADGLKHYRETYFTDPYPNLVIDSLSIANQDNDTLPLIQSVDWSTNLSHSGNYWFFPFNLFLGLNYNPFTNDNRLSDVTFAFGSSYRIAGSLTIPDGFMFESVPRNMQLIMEDTSIVLQRLIQVDDNKVNFRITIDFGKPVYAVSEYPVLKEFCKKLYATLNEQAVIRKKN